MYDKKTLYLLNKYAACVPAERKVCCRLHIADIKNQRIYCTSLIYNISVAVHCDSDGIRTHIVRTGILNSIH